MDSQALLDAARELGVDPTVLAGIIHRETAGTMSPDQWGGMRRDGSDRGRFLGLIQFSPQNQQTYNVQPGMSFADQMRPVVRYIQDRFREQGMNTATATPAQLYASILAGNPLSVGERDVNNSASGAVGDIMQRGQRLARQYGWGSNPPPAAVVPPAQPTYAPAGSSGVMGAFAATAPPPAPTANPVSSAPLPPIFMGMPTGFKHGGNVDMRHSNGKHKVAAALDMMRRRFSGGPVRGYEEGGNVEDGPLIPGGLPPLPEPRETELDRYHARQAALDAMANQPPPPPSSIPTLGRESPLEQASQAYRPTMADVTDVADQLPQGVNRGLDSAINAPWNLFVRGPAALAGYDLPEGRYFSRFNSDRAPATELGAGAGALGELGALLSPAGAATMGPTYMAAGNMLRGVGRGVTALPRPVQVGLAGTAAAVGMPTEGSTQADADPIQAEIRQQEAVIERTNREIQQVNNRVWPTRAARENATAPLAATARRAQDEIDRLNGERRQRRDQQQTAALGQRGIIIDEADAARRRVLDEAPTPFQNTAIGRYWGAAPMVMGGITGALMGLRHSVGDRFAAGRLANAVADATAGGRTSQGFMAGNTARNIAESFPRYDGVLAQHLAHMRAPAVAGGIEGAIAPNLPNAWNMITQSPVNPEYAALQAYLRLLPPDVEGQPALQARTRERLADTAALPQENPYRRAAVDYYGTGQAVPSMLGSALEGAGSAAFMSGIFGAGAPTPGRIAALRAQTEALPQPPTPRARRGPQSQEPPAQPGSPPPGSPTPPSPAPQAAPQSGAPQSPAPTAPTPPAELTPRQQQVARQNRRKTGNRGRFVRGFQKEADPADEAAAWQSNPDRLNRGQKDGGRVGAMDLVHKYAHGGAIARGRANYADGGSPWRTEVALSSPNAAELADATAGVPTPGRLDLLAAQGARLRPPPPRPVEPSEMGIGWRMPRGYETGGTPTAPPEPLKHPAYNATAGAVHANIHGATPPFLSVLGAFGARRGAEAGTAAADSDTVNWMRQALRERALNGPSGYEMLSQVSALPIGGSRAGAGIARDWAMAHRLDRRLENIEALGGLRNWDPGITGGRISLGNGQYIPSIRSVEGGMNFMEQPGVRPAGRDLAPFYPVRQDYPTASNTNLPRGFEVIQGGLPPLPGRAQGGNVQQGVVSGPILGATGGREDAKPVNVESGCYVLPADFVSGVGSGNTMAGHRTIEQVFGPSHASPMAAGGSVPIAISDGEHVLSREQVTKIGHGDHAAGCKALDALVKQARAKNIQTLRSLPAPAKD